MNLKVLFLILLVFLTFYLKPSPWFYLPLGSFFFFLALFDWQLYRQVKKEGNDPFLALHYFCFFFPSLLLLSALFMPLINWIFVGIAAFFALIVILSGSGGTLLNLLIIFLIGLLFPLLPWQIAKLNRFNRCVSEKLPALNFFPDETGKIAVAGEINGQVLKFRTGNTYPMMIIPVGIAEEIGLNKSKWKSRKFKTGDGEIFFGQKIIIPDVYLGGAHLQNVTACIAEVTEEDIFVGGILLEKYGFNFSSYPPIQ